MYIHVGQVCEHVYTYVVQVHENVCAQWCRHVSMCLESDVDIWFPLLSASILFHETGSLTEASPHWLTRLARKLWGSSHLLPLSARVTDTGLLFFF